MSPVFERDGAPTYAIRSESGKARLIASRKRSCFGTSETLAGPTSCASSRTEA